MATSNVRSIESLESFHAGMIRLSGDWQKVVEEVRMLVHRAEDHFSHDLPAHWRRQLQLAERKLCEAQNELSIKQSAPRGEDRPPATEAVQRVRAAVTRVRLCETKNVSQKNGPSKSLINVMNC